MEDVEWGEGVRAVLKLKGKEPTFARAEFVNGVRWWAYGDACRRSITVGHSDIEWVRDSGKLLDNGWACEWPDIGPSVWTAPKNRAVIEGGQVLISIGDGPWVETSVPAEPLRQGPKSTDLNAQDILGEAAETDPWWKSAEMGTLAYVKHKISRVPLYVRLDRRLGKEHWHLIDRDIKMSFRTDSSKIEWAEPKAHYLAAMPQPAPAGGHGDIWADIIAKTEPGVLRELYVERRRKGLEQYGTPLRYYCGRNLRVDAVQELLDTIAYLKGAGLGRLLPKVEGLLLEVLLEIAKS